MADRRRCPWDYSNSTSSTAAATTIVLSLLLLFFLSLLLLTAGWEIVPSRKGGRTGKGRGGSSRVLASRPCARMMMKNLRSCCFKYARSFGREDMVTTGTIIEGKPRPFKHCRPSSTVASREHKSASSYASAGSPAGVDLNLWTFNLRTSSRSERDGINGWPHRREAVVKMIQKYNADIVATQEGRIQQLEYLDEALESFRWIGCCRNGTHEDEHCAIFFNKEKFTLIQEETIWLSETPHIEGSVGWDGAKARIATWVLLGLVQGEKEQGHHYPLQICIVNTHLDHVGVRAREESAKALLSLVDRLQQKFPEAFIALAGDFNSVKSNNKVYETLARGGGGGGGGGVQGLYDMWKKAKMTNKPGQAPRSTIHKFLGVNFAGEKGDGSVELGQNSKVKRTAAAATTTTTTPSPSPGSPDSAVLWEEGGGAASYEGGGEDSQHIDWLLYRGDSNSDSSKVLDVRIITCRAITDSLADVLNDGIEEKERTRMISCLEAPSPSSSPAASAVSPSQLAPLSTTPSSSSPSSSLPSMTERYPSDHFPVAAEIQLIPRVVRD